MARLEHYIPVGAKRLRCGYTTGTCAAAAARCATELLLCGKLPEEIQIDTPSGITVSIEPKKPSRGENWASCAVRKDSGDDPDVTDGVFIYAKVQRIPSDEIIIEGGQGVGRITRPGLDQPVGFSAINRVPREMIEAEVRKCLESSGVSGGLKVTISIPDGEEIAKRTFNPRLGIDGGISVLGTSGIVRPMSQSALIDCLKLEMDILIAEGKRDILVTPGNYGDIFCTGHLGIKLQSRVSCSNYLGECIDHALGMGAKSVLLVGHLGKLIKVAAGNMNTHSRVSDGRRETFTAHTALCGGTGELVKSVFDSATTDEAVERLMGENLKDAVMLSLASALEEKLKLRAGDMKIGAVFFSQKYGVLGKTSGADELIERHRGDIGNEDKK